MKKRQSFSKRIISSKFLRAAVAVFVLALLLTNRIQSESAEVINSEAASIENVTVTSGYVAIVNGEEVAVASESEALATAFVEAKDTMSLSLSFEDPELEIIEKQMASTDLEESTEEDLEAAMEQAILATTVCEEYIYKVTVTGEEECIFFVSATEEIEAAVNAAITDNTEYDFCAVCVEDADGIVTLYIVPSDSYTSVAESGTATEEDLVLVSEDETVKLELLTGVAVEKVPESEGTLVSASEAEDILTGYYSDPVYYSVESGDCFSSIASDYGITVDELLAMNEGYTTKTILHIGDTLLIENYEKIMRFRVTKTYETEEEVPYETEYIENDSWYENVSETVVEGVNGTKVVSYEEVIEDGETVSLTVTGEEVVEEAVNEQIEIGTVEVPSYIYPVNATITSYYGERWGRMHKGIDFGVSIGTSVYASRGGTVIRASSYSSFGNCVEIQHSDGSVTRYAHLSSFAVSVGDVVSQGQLIAYSGNTGNSTGPHLHFEILINGVQVDPLLYLTK